ncbi:MAG TPA: pyridoxamine 5'-phosphate oxidase family protein [Clostridiaceae bacterium]|nr:pyridoxamine 5'-phosphate oxidase family protein [Clostridiaceae bacterium]
MLKTAHKILSSNHLCVLSTCGDRRPNSSLMQYVCNGDYTEVYLMTMKGSTKHQNIMSHPQVSLLVDTRTDADEKEKLKALTVYGHAIVEEGGDRAKALREALVRRNPDLSVFSTKPDACVITIIIEDLLLLDGLVESSFITLEPPGV